MRDWFDEISRVLGRHAAKAELTARSVTAGADSPANDRDMAPAAQSQRTEPAEQTRRQTLRTNTVAALAAAILMAPICIYHLAQGSILPSVVGLGIMASAALSEWLLRRDNFGAVVAIHLFNFFYAGTLFGLANPALVDFGLATILITPIYAALLTRPATQRKVWMITASLVTLLVLQPLTPILFLTELDTLAINLLAGVAFVIGGLITGYTVRRLSRVYAVIEQSHVRAFQHLVENVQDAVVRYSATGEMMFISGSAESLFGCRRYQLSGTGLIDRMHVLDRPAFLSALSHARLDGRASGVELRMRRDLINDSTYFWLEVTLSPILASGDASRGYEVVAVLRDVTTRKDTEQELRAAHQEAQATSMAKSKFLATIGHELRTPLNAIVGFTDMMLNNIGGELSEDHEEYARLIRQSGHHLLDTVTMLLDMSKIEAGKFELQTETFDPAEIVEPCLAMVEGAAAKREIRLVRNVGGHLPQIVGDERACRQMLINLVSNAIKFSAPNSAVRIDLKVRGASLVMSVSDDGIGMSEQDAARIGEPFFQAQNGLDRRYEGAGLGLSIVRGLVELHEGKMKVDSRLGEGTTVSISLPINGPSSISGHTAVLSSIEDHRESVEPAEEVMPVQVAAGGQ